MTMGWMETIRFTGLDLQVAVNFAVQGLGPASRAIKTAWSRIPSHAPPSGPNRVSLPGAASDPNELTRRVRLTDSRVVTVRPIRPEDAALVRDFVNELSPRSRYQRFMFTFRELPPEMLVRFTEIDYRQEMALIAVLDAPERECQVGVARYSTLPDGRTCEFAIVVADDCQGQGLARELMQSLIDAARERGLCLMTGVCLRENVRMQRFARALGFSSTRDPDDPQLVRMNLTLWWKGVC